MSDHFMLAMLDGKGRADCESVRRGSNPQASTNMRVKDNGGRPVSKTVQRGFESFHPCHNILCLGAFLG